MLSDLDAFITASRKENLQEIVSPDLTPNTKKEIINLYLYQLHIYSYFKAFNAKILGLDSQLYFEQGGILVKEKIY